MREDLPREQPPQIEVIIAALESLEHARVVRRVDDCRHCREVLRGGPQERGTADIDLLDHVVGRDVGPRGGLAKRVQVHHDQADVLDPGLLDLPLMLRQIPPGQNPAMHGGVQRLDASVEHLRHPREVRDVANGQTARPQRGGGPAGRDQLPLQPDETSREFDQASLVGDGQKRDRHEAQLLSRMMGRRPVRPP